MPHTYRLRLPGPVTVPLRVQQACAGVVVNHRGPEFRARMAAIQARLQPLVGCSRRLLLFSSTGTGMMEASLVNTCAPGEQVLVCINGQFGERYASIARNVGLSVDVFEFPWGSAIAVDQLSDQIRRKD